MKGGKLRVFPFYQNMLVLGFYLLYQLPTRYKKSTAIIYWHGNAILHVAPANGSILAHFQDKEPPFAVYSGECCFDAHIISTFAKAT